MTEPFKELFARPRVFRLLIPIRQPSSRRRSPFVATHHPPNSMNKLKDIPSSPNEKVLATAPKVNSLSHPSRPCPQPTASTSHLLTAPPRKPSYTPRPSRPLRPLPKHLNFRFHSSRVPCTEAGSVPTCLRRTSRSMKGRERGGG